ncbi:hypothetical protein MKW98_016578 [Papaver atlanticum]|uniref:RPM1 interacting protein 13 n=1 Tax=Papaver atlanticum TaxID=357466 RepID=A0AAD4S6P5_9MAGN|nr:hypothetical protein MKW98_016578 [Papaver atlanticum]
MSQEPIIFDISSDDEEEDNGGVQEERKETEDDQIDWLSELLDSAESIKDDDSSDDVVFVSEVSCSSNKLRESRNNNNKKASDLKKPGVIRNDDDDDDCLILDEDPENPVAVENNSNENESDELLVVSEKGQVACRDYPHSREQCATYPFRTAPHEKYCDLCHCYVCDLRAPCKYWGTGLSKNDHCHASDKEEIWKAQRKCFKLKATLAMQKLPGTTSSKPHIASYKSASTFPLTQPMGNGSFLSHSVSSAAVRPCLPNSNFGVPNIINRRSTNIAWVASVPLSRNRYPDHISSRSPLMSGGGTTNNNIARRDRDRVGVALGPHPHTNFKRVGSVGVGALPKHRFAHSSSVHYNDPAQKSQAKRIYQPSVNVQGVNYHNQRCQNSFGTIDSAGDNTYKNLSQPSSTISGNSADALYDSEPSSNMQHLYPVEIPVSNITNSIPSEYNFNWFMETQPTVDTYPMAEVSQIPGLQPTSVPPLPVDGTDPFYGSPHEINVNPTGQSELDNWFDSLANQSVLGTASNDTVPSQSDFVSSQADLLGDGVFVFDFENC